MPQLLESSKKCQVYESHETPFGTWEAESWQLEIPHHLPALPPPVSYSLPAAVSHWKCPHFPETSTVCKICDLSFETDQVLLQHMKDNHKPGEMPYVCQVCSYRSSFFADVDAHFRAYHGNTKNLLCPFCLKILKTVTPYICHYRRHWKKSFHQCPKCQLQFLTCKEKREQKTQCHQMFKKPKQLEGLPPETKVLFRYHWNPFNQDWWK